MTEYIKREDAIDAMYKVSDDNVWIPFHNEQLLALDGLHAADVQPVVHGRWVTETDGCVVCSECGNSAEINGITGEFMESPYCSECGAKMDGEEDG